MTPPRKPPTMAVLARVAGVSPMTVSRVKPSRSTVTSLAVNSSAGPGIWAGDVGRGGRVIAAATLRPTPRTDQAAAKF